MQLMEDPESQESSYEKRFQMPEDEELRERLKGIQHTVRDFQREYPEILSFSMYGSLVKDTARSESDIDGTLFVDTTASDDETYDQQISDKLQSGEYLDRFREELQERLDLTPEQIAKDVGLETISESEVASAAQEYICAQEQYEKDRETWESTKRDTGKVEPGFGGDVPVYEYNGEEPQPPDLPSNIKAMFNLDIGGGIKKYRRQFLESLESVDPEQADDICRSIAAYLSFTEGGKRKEQAKLPHTFEDFKRAYL